MKFNKILVTFLLGIILTFSSCKTTLLYIPVPVETVKTEYVVKKDSIYIHDSIDVYKEVKGDTFYISKVKYQTKTIVKTDTIAKTDTVSVVVEVPVTVEVNKLHRWLKLLMYLGGVGVLVLLGMLIHKFKLWKLLF